MLHSAPPAWVEEVKPRRGSWAASKDRVRRWARSERERLIRLLGGRCVRCERDDIPMHFDHIHGVTYKLASLSQHMRIVRLRREVAAGLIQLLCEICNKKKGKPRRASG